MDLEKKLEQIKPYQLNCNVFSVYDYPDTYSMQELLNKFFDTINNCVELCNNVLDLAKWLVTIGLEQEVAKKLQQWLEDGTLAKIINEELLGELNNKIQKIDGKINDIVDQYLFINVMDYGAKGDGVNDDTQSILKAKEQAILYKKPLYFPKGVYLFTDLGNFAITDFSVFGSGHKEVTLKCISNVQNHKAIRFDAYESGLSNSPILMGMKFKNIIVEGNGLTQYIIYCQGVARMDWENIYYRNGNGIGVQFNGCHENHFKNLSIGHNYTGVTELNPSFGIQFDWGIRGGVIEGRSTNNTFQNCYTENTNTIGINLINGDQNIFISCASQANNGLGCKIQKDCRMTTFIGCGFEKNNGNPSGDAIDLLDEGRLTTYINSYTQKTLSLNGHQSKIVSGNYKSIKNNGYYNEISNVRVNYSGKDEGGFIDNGVGTKIGSICDINEPSENQYKFYLRPRKNIIVGESPFTYTNNSGRMEEVIVQTGNLVRIQKKRGADNPFLCSHLTPNSHILAPTESLIFTWEGDENKPSVSTLIYNGY